MKHDELIGQVQARAHLDSRGAAETATRATLETLAERVSAGAAANLAAQLPQEIGRHLRAYDGDPAVTFGADDFYRRVAERSGPGTDERDATLTARAVLSVVSDAVTGGAYDDVAAALPPEYEPVMAGLDARPDEQRGG